MTLSSRSTLSQSLIDRGLTGATRLCAMVSAAIVLLVIAFLVWESMPALADVGLTRFFTDDSWHPLYDQFNLLPMIAATALTTGGALLLAGPLGIASAVFSQYYAPPLISNGYRRLVELLAGIPSVVFGLWGLVVLAPLIAGWGGSGQSLLTATLVLGLMILPTIALTTHSALRAVPRQWIAGGAALGFDRWAIAWRIALPAARRGITVGILLALARALGETMAVLMLAGNVVEMPDSILSPVRTLTANIALEMGYASSSHRSILFVSGLILMSVVVGLVALSELAGGKHHGER
ncbi:MAG: phosphate ABC transporter permease subunit PstC [Pirellulales bacterium]|nr:phosphate ABC transporter permease subunit PstC [Pirellulales bacterium]